jgi:hypothetical protein
MKKDRAKLVVEAFIVDLIENSTYTVFEKPKYSNTIAINNGFRPATKSTGDNRKKAINLNMKAFTPSQGEIVAYIDKWLRTRFLGLSEDDDIGIFEIIMKFMDDFVLDFTIVERINTYRDVKLISGYNKAPSRETMEESVVNFHVKYLTPRREDIEKYAKMWLQEQGWSEE